MRLLLIVAKNSNLRAILKLDHDKAIYLRDLAICQVLLSGNIPLNLKGLY